MTPPGPVVLRDLRLAGVCRRVCQYAGLPVPPAAAGDDRFVLRSGAEPPDLLARLLEEAFVEGGAEVVVWRATDTPDYGGLPPGGLAVRPGFDAPCPAADDLRRAAGGRAVLFAVERRGPGGELLGLTWAALPEDEPAPADGFRAAVLRANPV